MNKEYAMGLDFKVYLKSTSQSFVISRVTGKYFTQQMMQFHFPGGEYADFQNNYITEGECAPMPEKRKF